MEIINKKSKEITELVDLIEKLRKTFFYYKDISKPLLNGELYLDNRDMTRLLKISGRSLQDYRDKGILAFYKLEGKILYRQSDVLKFLEDNYYATFKEE